MQSVASPSDTGPTTDITHRWSFRVDYRRTKETPPERPFIDAIEELARLTALFGFEEEALKVFNEARERVFEWRKNRQPQ